ncbi:hypothetical protein KFK09_019235 [Dendrobium nobile]|uniref:Uncharacterized protein n=1 Tax=Dendrobium nobile TaxID=94219 RepID=A0A8T3AY08_DENNO|nr:hypothetical protein KFK09_019235 [Dendrobium nobile]
MYVDMWKAMKWLNAVRRRVFCPCEMDMLGRSAIFHLGPFCALSHETFGELPQVGASPISNWCGNILTEN